MKAENIIGPASIVDKLERPYLGIRFETLFGGMFAVMTAAHAALGAVEVRGEVLRGADEPDRAGELADRDRLPVGTPLVAFAALDRLVTMDPPGHHASMLAGGTYVALPGSETGMSNPFAPDFSAMAEAWARLLSRMSIVFVLVSGDNDSPAN